VLAFQAFSPAPQENLAEMSTSGHAVAHSTPLPPSNQLGVSIGQVAEVPTYSQPDPLFHPIGTVDPSEVRSSQAVDLIRVLRQFVQRHPGTLGNMVAASAPVSMCGADQPPYNVRPPRSDWPIPPLPLEADWNASASAARTYKQDLNVYHLVNAAQSLARVCRTGAKREDKDRGGDLKIHDISVGYGPRAFRLLQRAPR